MIITGIEQDDDLCLLKARCLASYLFFLKTFYKIRTGRDFSESFPIGRESHHLIVSRQLERVFYLETMRLLINLPPGHYKSTMLQHFVAWCWAHYPDCQFLYLSYAWDEAAKNTYVIKQIVELPEYRDLFGVKIASDSSAKDDFKTIQGGTLRAYGSGGAVTGKDAGFPGCDRFSGCLIMDDMHKPDEVHSDNTREGVKTNYEATITHRVRGPKVPRIFLGQRLHEADLPAYFIDGQEGFEWDKVILKALDGAGNALDPNVRTKEQLLIMRERNEYIFSAQYQQDPQPAGGGIFKVDNFYMLEEEPTYIKTFITADTAETDKDYNDASVFSFWGLYKINDLNRGAVDTYALHWIDCMEIRVEPKELRQEFLGFYSQCSMHKVPPSFAAIEKKSTGVTLLSVLSEVRGLQQIPIDRTALSKSKTDRFLSIQDYVNQKLISLPTYGKHTKMCLEHCRKITANNSHRHDDIADTLYDAVKIALMDKLLINMFVKDLQPEKVIKTLASINSSINNIRTRIYG